MMTHQKARLTTRNLCQCLGAFVLLLSASSTAAGADASFQELEQQGTLDKREPARADDGKNYPRLVLHGDYRFLYGKGRFHADVPQGLGGPYRRVDQDHFRAEQRLRIFPFLETSGSTSIRTMLEDKRDRKDESRRQRLKLSRLYVQHENAHTKLEAGRFNYYLMDGNVIDKRIDGLRFRTGDVDWPQGSLAVFVGRTTDEPDKQKDGVSLLWKKRLGKMDASAAYLDFRQHEDLPASLPKLHKSGIKAGRDGDGFDRQHIASLAAHYHPTEKWKFGLEVLHSDGRHNADDYRESERGFVALVQYGVLDEARAGSFSTWLRYYDQPSSSVLYPTMDADSTFFRRQGFRGWGVRTDYVIAPGLACAVEGFRLENRSEGAQLRAMHEYILGTSVTAYF